MKKKLLAASLICAVALVTVAPPKTLAQTTGQPVVVRTEQNVSVARAKLKPDLKALFAEEVAKNKSGTLTEADIERLEKARLAQTVAQPSSGFSKKEKVLLVVFLVVITAVAIVLVHNGVEPRPLCEEEPATPDCIP